MAKNQRPTKKSTSKIRRFFAWFKPTGPAKGILLFALVFGAIGGGIAIKHSFAGGWWVPTNEIVPQGGSNSAIRNIDKVGKSEFSVITMPGARYWNDPNRGRAYADIYIPAERPRYMYYCIVGRNPESPGSGRTVTIIRADDITHNVFLGQNIVRVPTSSSYAEYCMYNTADMIPGSLIVRVSVDNGQGFTTNDLSRQRFFMTNITAHW